MNTKIKKELSKLKKHPDNPRLIKNNKYKKLLDSITEDPEFMEKRPLIVNKDLIVLGGNMRLQALRELGYKETWIDIADWPLEKQKRFVIKDNANFGEWDFDILANEWDIKQLNNWGVDTPKVLSMDDSNDIYSKKINAPYYEPSEVKPELENLIDADKYYQLIEKIEKSNIDKKTKEFLKLAATRHIVFYFDKIADYYSNSNEEEKDLFEKNALVIIDFDKAIRNGYVELQESIYDQYEEDYG